ncbi:MAG TPA: hypothetical protein PK141_13415 [Polyangiaceae bacterium]|nr:hypothetical protein [Polyangiaceae bacterium]
MSRPELWLELVGVAGVRTVATLGVLATGFRAISDDDYARVVIAEQWVAAPRLDPSGTSWLPFPFWVMGATMTSLGRSLATARLASIALSIVAGVALHGALVASEVPRRSRVVGLATLFLLPWTLWTTAATVPEAPTAAFLAAGVLLAALPAPRASGATAIAAGALTCAATLSRYEAWPAAVVVAALLARSARSAAGGQRAAVAAGALLALAGPFGWMAWNQASHGSATHFVARVAGYKRALGGPQLGVLERVWAYPGLLLVHLPETSALGALVAFASAARWRGRRSSVTLSTPAPFATASVACALAATAVVAFLVYGNLRDGAPTHHAERALLPVAFLLVPVGVAELFASGSQRLRRGAALLAGAAGLLALSRLAHPPGGGETSRAQQVSEGERLRAAGAPAIRVVPCAYEHFALVAAHAAPERVLILARQPGAARCPEVTRAAVPPPL